MSDIEDYTICVLVVPNPYFQLIQVMIGRERELTSTLFLKRWKSATIKTKQITKVNIKSSYWRLTSKPWQFMPLETLQPTIRGFDLGHPAQKDDFGVNFRIYWKP